MTIRDVPAFYINLDDARDRAARTEAELSTAGLDPVRLPAFDGRGLPEADWPGYDRAGALRYMGRPLLGGEVGCFLSHLAAARAVIDSGAPMALVFEDDVEAAPGAAETLGALLETPQIRGGDWDLCNLCPAMNTRIVSRVAALPPEGGGRWLVRAHYYPMVCAALLWTREGARRFVDGHGRIDCPVDNHLRRALTRSDRGLAVDPGPFRQTGAPSTIGAREAGATEAPPRPPGYGLRKQRRLWGDKLRAGLNKLARGRAASRSEAG